MKPSKEISYLGAWIDHDKAQFYNPAGEEDHIEILNSEMGKPGKETHSQADVDGQFIAVKHEYKQNSKKREETKAYFKQLTEKLKAADNIVLFGPGTFIKEFMNHLSEDKHFADKNIECKPADKFTIPQFKQAIKKHFSESVAFRRVNI